MKNERFVCLRCKCEFDVEIFEPGEQKSLNVGGSAVKCRECKCTDVMKKSKLP